VQVIHVAEIRRALMVDTSGAGFSASLVELRDALLRRLPDLEIDYHLVNDRVLEGDARARVVGELKRRCTHADVVVCANDSLPARVPEPRVGQRRVLLYPPQLSAGLGGSEPSARPPLYTDVVVQSEYFVPQASARFPAGTIRPLGLPALDVLAMPSRRLAALSKLYQHCPSARGRRILGVSSKAGLESLLGCEDALALSRVLADDYFLVVRVPKEGAIGDECDASLSAFMFNSGPCFTPLELFSIADELVTDRFSDAVYFSATGRPMAVLDGDGTKTWAQGLTIRSLRDVPAMLADGGRAEPAVEFRDRVVGRHVTGNSERILDAVLP